MPVEKYRKMQGGGHVNPKSEKLRIKKSKKRAKENRQMRKQTGSKWSSVQAGIDSGDFEYSERYRKMGFRAPDADSYEWKQERKTKRLLKKIRGNNPVYAPSLKRQIRKNLRIGVKTRVIK